jgi:hypothetical protein
MSRVGFEPTTAVFGRAEVFSELDGYELTAAVRITAIAIKFRPPVQVEPWTLEWHENH